MVKHIAGGRREIRKGAAGGVDRIGAEQQRAQNTLINNGFVQFIKVALILQSRAAELSHPGSADAAVGERAGKKWRQVKVGGETGLAKVEVIGSSL